MPAAAPRPCTQPGCRAYAVKDGRCSTHPRPAWFADKGKRKAHDERRGSSHQRGYGAAWRRLRAQVLTEAPLCRACEQAGRVTRATLVDHIVPKVLGGTDDRVNLQSLCAPCHDRKTKQDGSYGRR